MTLFTYLTSFLVWGGGARQENKIMCFSSQTLHHFNKAIREGIDSSNSIDKEKGYYVKRDIENCDKY